MHINLIVTLKRSRKCYFSPHFSHMLCTCTKWMLIQCSNFDKKGSLTHTHSLSLYFNVWGKKRDFFCFVRLITFKTFTWNVFNCKVIENCVKIPCPPLPYYDGSAAVTPCAHHIDVFICAYFIIVGNIDKIK